MFHIVKQCLFLQRLLREIYPERNVMKSKPVLPAPVPQAQVSLPKGARNDTFTGLKK